MNNAINHAPIDRWTAGHFALGIAAGLLGLSRNRIFIGAIAWELVERPLKRTYPTMFPHPTQDTLINAVLDASAVMLGWWIVTELRTPGAR